MTSRELAKKVADWIEPDDNPAGVVYGTMIVGAVLATESAKRETLLGTLGATVLVLLLYWLAHSYASTLGERLENDAPLRPSALLRTLAHEQAIVHGASIPIAALLIASAAGASLATAVLVAAWTSAGTVVLLELISALRAHLRGIEMVTQVCAGALMGLTIIALRVVLH